MGVNELADVKLDAIHQRVVVDRARVGGAGPKRLAILLARSAHVGAGHASERTISIESISMWTAPDAYRPPTFTFGRCQSRNESVIRPEATPSRNSGLNCI